MTNEVGEPILYEQMIIADAPRCLSTTAQIQQIQQAL